MKNRDIITAAHESADEILRNISPEAGPIPEVPGYDSLRFLRRGGQGIVYKGIQRSTRRSVAVKVLREGPLSLPHERKRFEREAYILGQLQHPNIVTIHDSGYVSGSPFFVMDFVPGESLDAYIVSHGLSIPEILRLFIKVARAVHAAHVLGVVHRDLKPSNVRVDEQGEPRILDFGLAKFSTVGTTPGLGDSITITEQFLGSVPWSSPEQAGSTPSAVDARSDVYSLGVMLFHALTSTFPHAIGGSPQEIFNRIAVAEPPRPSSLNREIDRDLDTIVLKCLEKDLSRRYTSAAALADDLGHLLNGEPILARAPSAIYQLSKLVRRHRFAFSLLAMFMIVTTGLAVGMTILFQRAARDRNRAASAEVLADERRAQAEAAAEAARFTREFLIADVIGTDPWSAGGRDSTVGDALERAAKRLQESPPEDDRIRAELEYTVGGAYLARGQNEEARWHLVQAIEGYSRLAQSGEFLIRAQMALAEALSRKGEAEQASELAFTTWQEAQEALGEDHPTAMDALKVRADLRWRFQQDAEAAGLAEVAAARCAEILGEEHLTSLSAQALLAVFVRPWQGRTAEAVEVLRGLLETYRRIRGEESPEALSTEGHLGPMLRDQGYLAEAEVLLVKTHERFVRVFGEESGEAISAAIHLAILRRSQNRLAEAAELLEHSAAAAERGFGVDHSHYQSSIQYLASVYGRQGRLCKAGPMAEQLLESRRRTLGSDHIGTCTSEVELAATYYTVGRFAEAEPLARHAIGPFSLHYDDGGNSAIWPKLWLARILVALSRDDEAEALAEEALAARRDRTDRAGTALQDVLYYARDLLGIEPERLRDPQQALDRLEAVRCADPSDAMRVDHYIAIASAEMGDFDRAIALMERVLHVTPEERSQTRDEREDLLVKWYEAIGDPESGVELLRTTLNQREEIYTAADEGALHARLRLAEALLEGGRFAEAAAVLGDCAGFDTIECADWRHAKCRGLRALSRAALGQPDGVGDSFLAAYEDLEADPWAPELERSKARRRFFAWLTATIPY